MDAHCVSAQRECRYTIPQLQKLFEANFESALRKLYGSQQPELLSQKPKVEFEKPIALGLERAVVNSPTVQPIRAVQTYTVIVQRRMRGRYRRYKTLDTGEKGV